MRYACCQRCTVDPGRKSRSSRTGARSLRAVAIQSQSTVSRAPRLRCLPSLREILSPCTMYTSSEMYPPIEMHPPREVQPPRAVHPPREMHPPSETPPPGETHRPGETHPPREMLSPCTIRFIRKCFNAALSRPKPQLGHILRDSAHGSQEAIVMPVTCRPVQCSRQAWV